MPLNTRLACSLVGLVALGVTPACGDTSSRAAVSAKGPHAAPGEDPSCANKLTAYPGDCRAPPPLDPEVGVTAHYGPRNYDDPADVSGYVLAPGGEAVDCVYSRLTNPGDLYYNTYDVASRPGTHHVILYAAQLDLPDGTHDDCAQRDHGSALLAVLQGGLDGSVYHYPPSGKIPPENAALGTKLTAFQTIVYELHAVNTTAEPLLRENWTSFHAMPKDRVTTPVGQMAFNGGLSMNIPPHSRQTVTNSCTVPETLGTVRVVDFFAHMHAHGERFSAFVVRPDPSGGETRTLVYESYDWSQLDLIEFNSVVQNPKIEYQGGKPGGYSGLLELAPGDRLDYECVMNNTTGAALTFAAKAFTGEMCNLFGSFAPGASWVCAH